MNTNHQRAGPDKSHHSAGTAHSAFAKMPIYFGCAARLRIGDDPDKRFFTAIEQFARPGFAIQTELDSARVEQHGSFAGFR
jgi:hypothetical protein